MSIDNHEIPLRTIQELRTADAPQLYRPHTTSKPKPFDWDAITPTCTSCGTRTGQVNTDNGLCPTCDPNAIAPGPAPRPTNMPRRAPRQPRDPGQPRKTGRRPQPVDTDAIIEAYAGGQAISSIAAALQIQPTRVRSELTANNIELRDDRGRGPAGRRCPHNQRRSTCETCETERRAARTVTRNVVDEHAIVAAYLNGATAPDLATLHQCTPKRVRTIVTRHGHQLRDDRATRSGGRKIQRDPALIERIRVLYVDQALTQAQVADTLGCSEKVIWRIIRDEPTLAPRPSAAARSQAGIGRPNKLHPDTHQALINRYLSGEPAPSIARSMNCSPAAIYDLLKRYAVPRRPRGRYRKADAA